MSMKILIETEEDLERAENELSRNLQDDAADSERTMALMAEILAYRNAQRTSLEGGYPPGDTDDAPEGGSKDDADLDEALDDSFPASDPPAPTSPGKAG